MKRCVHTISVYATKMWQLNDQIHIVTHLTSLAAMHSCVSAFLSWIILNPLRVEIFDQSYEPSETSKYWTLWDQLILLLYRRCPL